MDKQRCHELNRARIESLRVKHRRERHELARIFRAEIVQMEREKAQANANDYVWEPMEELATINLDFPQNKNSRAPEPEVICLDDSMDEVVPVNIEVVNGNVEMAAKEDNYPQTGNGLGRNEALTDPGQELICLDDFVDEVVPVEEAAAANAEMVTKEKDNDNNNNLQPESSRIRTPSPVFLSQRPEPEPQPGPSRIRTPSPVFFTQWSSSDESETGQDRVIPFDPKRHYTVEHKVLKVLSKFKTNIHEKRIRFKHLEEINPSEYYSRLQQIFDSLVSTTTDNLTGQDMARFYINCKSWKQPINLPYMKIDELTGKRILHEFTKTDQSNGASGLTDDTLDMCIMTTKLPDAGSGWSPIGCCRKRIYIDLLAWLKKKRGILTTIKNTDQLCFARAVVVAMAQFKSKMPNATAHDSTYAKLISDPRDRLQEDEAKALHTNAGVAEGPCGIPQFQQFQALLAQSDYRLFVISAEANFTPVYVGPDTCSKPISVLLYNKHFAVINSMTSLVNRSYFCWLCFKGFSNQTFHNCVKKCHSCRDAQCQTVDFIWVKCQICLRYFKGDECKQKHLNNGMCATIQRCKKCYLTLHQGVKHNCGQRPCPHCKEQVDAGHLCFIQKPQKQQGQVTNVQDHDDDDDGACTSTAPQKRKAVGDGSNQPKKQKIVAKVLKPVIYYFDVEAMQETGTHQANLVVVQHEDGSPAKQKNFKNDNESSARDKFCSWVFRERCGCPIIAKKPTQPFIFVAHYLKGYDGYFVLEYLYQHNLLPEVVFTGSKVMLLNVPQMHIKFIDSFNFLAMPLSKFPATFSLVELKKGYFPHLFNTADNQNYIGLVPDTKFYSPDSLSTSARESFMQWHNQQRVENVQFNLQEELVAYCISDVSILREGCERFRDLSVEQYTLDPLIESVTLASYCQLVYRTNFMPKDSIAIIPPYGYGGNTKQSAKALCWLSWLNRERGPNGPIIEHARNGGEFTVQGSNYKADGYDASTKTVYEFNGCYFHGCPRCFGTNTPNAARRCNMGEAFAQTLDRAATIRDAGYTVVAIWECEYELLLKTNNVMQEYIKTLAIQDKLDPRDAFFGGRTNCAKLHYKVKDDEEGRYYDFISLYPFINKYGKMPVAHPQVILFPQLPYIPGKYYGIVKCKVLPPTNLFHPVLPYRAHNLLFPLCRSCADACQTALCQHTEEERAITGTWITPELDCAISKGYKILELYELWHYAKTAEYSPTGAGDYPQGLFGAYVDGLLKRKTEASGWPSHASTEVEKATYLETFRQNEGILLDRNKIVHNPGLRTTSKLMLNSLWGKFAQRENLPKTEYVTDPARFFQLLTSPELDVTHLCQVNDEMVMLNIVKKDDFIQHSGRTNVVIAAFTTGLARLKLYELLDILGTDVLYMDTDSTIFKSKAIEDKLAHYLGDHLGKVTNELPTGVFINEFASGGPKNYTYTTSDGEEKYVVSGIRQNFKTKQKMSFKTIKSMVLASNDAPDVITFDDNEIVRDKYKATLVNKDTHKTYSVHFKKGIVDEATTTIYPYGFRF